MFGSEALAYFVRLKKKHFNGNSNSYDQHPYTFPRFVFNRFDR